MSKQDLFNTKLLMKMLQESEFEAIVAASPQNIFFTSGTSIARNVRDPSGEYRLFFTIIPKGGDPALITVGWEEKRASSTSVIKDIRPYVEFKTSPLEVLAEVLKEKGLSKTKVGIEKTYIISSYWEKLLSLLPEAKLIDCADLFARARCIKTPEAIELIRRSAYKTEKAIATAFATAKLGDTEKSLQKQMVDNIVKLGADATSFIALNSGAASYIVHQPARDVKIGEGDVVHVDFGGVFSGYNTDVSRNGVCVKASPKDTKRYKALWRAERAAIEETMRVGKKASDVYNSLEREFKKNNIPFEGYHGPGHVGHSIGLEVHEPPVLHPYNDTKLEKNMVLCIEPTVFEPGWEKISKGGRFHFEDMVLITEDGPEILSNYTTGEELFLIEP